MFMNLSRKLSNVKWSPQYCYLCSDYFIVGDQAVLSCSQDLFHLDCWEKHLEERPECSIHDYESLPYRKLREVIIGKEK